MGLSWSFSFSCIDLSQNNFEIAEGILKEFFSMCGDVVYCVEKKIECFNVDVRTKFWGFSYVG